MPDENVDADHSAALIADSDFVRAVPEPATMLLLGTSLLGLAVIRRKK